VLPQNKYRQYHSGVSHKPRLDFTVRCPVS